MRQIGLDKIIVDTFPNIREDMDTSAIDELVASIKEHGILSPLLVNPAKDGKYHLVYGHRRYTAAKQLGMKMVPVTIKKMKLEKIPLFQLVENLQREDLSVLEEARAYQRVLEDTGMEQQELAKVLGVSKSHVSQRLKLLETDNSVQAALENGNLDFVDVRGLSYLPMADQRKAMEKATKEAEKITKPPAKPSKPMDKAAAKKQAKEKMKKVVQDAVVSRRGARPGAKKSSGTLEERLAKAEAKLSKKFAEQHAKNGKLTKPQAKFFGDVLRFLLKEKRFIVG